jgi:hypothetical protein
MDRDEFVHRFVLEAMTAFVKKDPIRYLRNDRGVGHNEIRETAKHAARIASWVFDDLPDQYKQTKKG